MKRRLNPCWLPLCLGAALAAAKPFEIRLDFNAGDMQLGLRHPLYAADTTNPPGALPLDCCNAVQEPDWGVVGRSDDNPRLQLTPSSGGRLISADTLQDPGACGVLVRANSGTATCRVQIVSWPGAATGVFYKCVAQGETWGVTNLACAQDIGMQVLRAVQTRSGLFRIKATFTNLCVMSATTTFFRSSLSLTAGGTRDPEQWLYDSAKEVRVNKKGTMAAFGRPVRAAVRAGKTNILNMRVRAKYQYRNEQVRLFVGLQGWSGYAEIMLDKHRQYQRPK